MCGRFSLRVELAELLEYYGIAETNFDYVPRYNIAPGQTIPAIIDAPAGRRLGGMRWGLVPEWARDDKIGYKMINARADGVSDKPAFAKPFRTKRCIVPTDGFYEWRKTDKQPFRITLKDGGLLSLAALYDVWVSPDGAKLATVTIITTEANELMAPLHDRMPVILPRDRVGAWLDRSNTDPRALLPMLEPYDPEAMHAYPVNPLVGNAKNDVPACLEPYVPPGGRETTGPEQLNLF
mgnify:FL=1